MGTQNPLRMAATMAVVLAMNAGAESHKTNVAAMAADGAWAADTSGNWSDAGKWAGGEVASGPNRTADFTVNIAGFPMVTNDVDGLTIGHLKFADTICNWQGEAWTLAHPGNTLVLSTGGARTPSISFGSQWDFVYAPCVYIDARLGGSEGVEIRPLADMAYPGRVWFRRANTYGGLTTVSSNGFLNARVPGALGTSNTVVVKAGGVLVIGTTDAGGTNGATVYLESGATLVGQAASSYQAMTLTGAVFVAGHVAIKSAGGDYTVNEGIVELDAPIVETAPGTGVAFGNYPGSVYHSTLRVRRANGYTGPTIIQAGTRVYLDHPDGFGTNAETIALVGADNGWGVAELMLTGAGGELLNGSKSLLVGTNATVYQNDNTILTNTVTLAGGAYAGSHYGFGNGTNAGAMVLAAGTTSTVYRANNNPFDRWYQVGVMSGAGALMLKGANGNDCQLVFRGANTYSGGTAIDQNNPYGGYLGNGSCNWVGSDQAFGTGPVDFQDTTTNGVVFRLEQDVTMPNVFKGNGRVQTGAYTLTVTGGFAPGSAAAPLGALLIDKLKVGTDDRGATYTWSFTNGASDVVYADTLAFGKTTHTVQCEWLGQGVPPEGVHVLFAYAGDAPDLSGVNWAVEGLGGSGGKVSLDAANKRVVVTIRRQGSLILVW